jgi:hypothetical protein
LANVVQKSNGSTVSKGFQWQGTAGNMVKQVEIEHVLRFFLWLFSS